MQKRGWLIWYRQMGSATTANTAETDSRGRCRQCSPGDSEDVRIPAANERFRKMKKAIGVVVLVVRGAGCVQLRSYPFDGLPHCGLIEVVRDLIGYAYRQEPEPGE
jgi:hypothetical protein